MKRAFIALWVGLGLLSFVLSTKAIWATDLAVADPAGQSVLASSATPVPAADQPDILVFVRDGCQHCQDEEAFLAELVKTNPQLQVKYYRLENPEERQLWSDFTARIGTAKVTPLTIIGNELLIGFDTPEGAGQKIKEALDRAQKTGTVASLDSITPESLNQAAQTVTCPEDGSVPCAVPTRPSMTVQVPFIGPVNVEAYPLVVMSSVLGLIDGFNPCAMWVLVTFMIILLQVGSRRKMAIFAGVFILAEAIMYYLILTLWFKTWDFVRLDNIVTPIVGLVAIGSGLFFLWEWKKGKDECQVMDIEQRSQTRKKIKELAAGNFTFMTFVGILLLAFSVNVIEFACSIGIPQTFTKIIELNDPGWLMSQLYILLYILFYMVDDFIVFGLALYAADKILMTAKYSKWSNLIGGIIMILLGFVLIFKPTVLVF